MSKPLIIVGLQKSGTSLFKRILATSNQVNNIFPAEGNELWGNVPPFSPTADPVGRIYQHHNAINGHLISESDFSTKDAATIIARVNKLLLPQSPKPFWMTKNPYLTVRLPWLKKVFPDAVILACVRKPLPNVYSLVKRYSHATHGLKPENGWWGVKPKNWQKMVKQDPLETITNQWIEINKQLLSDCNHVDFFIPYHDFCTNPRKVLSQIQEKIHIDLNCQVPDLKCLDNQWETGGPTTSANQNAKHSEGIIPPLTQNQVTIISNTCKNIWNQINEQLKCQV